MSVLPLCRPIDTEADHSFSAEVSLLCQISGLTNLKPTIKFADHLNLQGCLKLLVPLAEKYTSMQTNTIDKHGLEIVSQILNRIDLATGQEFLSSEVGWKCFQDCLRSNLSYENEAVANLAVSIVSW